MATKGKEKSTLVHDTVCLFVITLIAGLLLGGINTITKKPIQDQNEKTKAEAYAAVYTGVEFTEDAEITKKLEKYNASLAAGEIIRGGQNYSDVEIAEVMKAQDNGADAGYVVTCSGKGYGGSITIALGIDASGAVKGIQITDCSNETPGLGQNCTNADWNNQYIGMNTTQEITVVKDGTGSADKATVNAISGATITSDAVTRAVDGTLNFIATLSE